MYMKMEMTRNQIADLPVDKIVTVGACELQDLLSGVDPIGYNAGICGWDYDVYVIGDVCILTGYRVLKKYPRAAKVEEYEREAHKIVSSRMPSLRIISELNKLREAFIAEQLHE